MPGRIIDTDLYPLEQLSSAVAPSWLSEIKASLKRKGSCTLANFVTREALDIMAQQANSILVAPGNAR